MLHIISPTNFTTSPSLFGLMRLTIRQLYQEDHQVIVIGNAEDETRCRTRGVPTLGSLGGAINVSRTLPKRLSRFIHQTKGRQTEKIIAWGWHALSVLSECTSTHDTCALVDEIDPRVHVNGCQIIPTTNLLLKYATTLGLSKQQISEQLVGIEPTTISVDRETVFEQLELQEEELFISIVGDIGYWQDILAMALRLKVANQKGTFVLSSTYRDRAKLMQAALQDGVFDMFRDVPPTLRQIDVIRHADCAWCPSMAPFDCSLNVLDVLLAAWEETPLACSRSHPVVSIPTIGSQIAWVSDDIECFGWLLDIASDSKHFKKLCAQRAAMVRSITSPSRFIESLQMRLHTSI